MKNETDSFNCGRLRYSNRTVMVYNMLPIVHYCPKEANSNTSDYTVLALTTHLNLLHNY